MKTVTDLILLFAASLITSTLAEDEPSSKTAVEDKSVESTYDALDLSIAIPPSSNAGRFLYYSHLRFSVVVTNHSEQSQRIFKEQYSWGYWQLSFEVTDAHGKVWKVEKGPHEWWMNAPEYWTLPAHEHLVIEVNLSDEKTWNPFPKVTNVKASVTIKAIFKNSPDDASKRLSVWTGRVVSKAQKYTLIDDRL